MGGTGNERLLWMIHENERVSWVIQGNERLLWVMTHE